MVSTGSHFSVINTPSNLKTSKTQLQIEMQATMGFICRARLILSASVVLLLILFFVTVTKAAEEWAKGCRPDVNYTKGSQVEKNINTVLKNLVTGSFSAADHRVSIEGQSPDRIYGIFQCRGDTNSSQCKSCAMDAYNALQADCLSERRLGGKVWMDLCFLRFENTSFIGVPDFAGYTVIINNPGKVPNPATFGNATGSLFRSLVAVLAVGSSKIYAAGSHTSVCPAVYGLVQCWNELSSEECNTCLRVATEFLFQYTQFKGVRSLFPNCMAVFATVKFFSDDVGNSARICVSAQVFPLPFPDLLESNHYCRSGGVQQY